MPVLPVTIMPRSEWHLFSLFRSTNACLILLHVIINTTTMIASRLVHVAKSSNYLGPFLRCHGGHSRASSTTLTSIPWNYPVCDGRRPRDDATNDNDHYRRPITIQEQQKRLYHSTPKQDMVLYGTILLVATLSYAGYKTYHGEPIKPKSASEAQSAYEKMEEDRQQRNQAHLDKQKRHKEGEKSD